MSRSQRFARTGCLLLAIYCAGFAPRVLGGDAAYGVGEVTPRDLDSNLTVAAPDGSFSIGQRMGGDTRSSYIVHANRCIRIPAERFGPDESGLSDSDHTDFDSEYVISDDSRYVARSLKCCHGLNHVWIYRVTPDFHLVNLLGHGSLDDAAWEYLGKTHHIRNVRLHGETDDNREINPGGFDDRVTNVYDFGDRSGCESVFFDTNSRRGEGDDLSYDLSFCLRDRTFHSWKEPR